MKNQNKAYIFAGLSVLAWSTVASAFKITLAYLDPLSLLLYSSLTSIIILFIILVVQKKLYLLKTYTPKQYGRSALMGLINPFAYYVILFKAYSLLPAQMAQPLNYTWPIMLALLSTFLLKQRLTIKSLIAIIISFAGVLIISSKGKPLTLEGVNIPGVLLALSSSIFWALYWIYNLKDTRDEIMKLFLNFSFGFIYILITTAIISGIKLPVTQAALGSVYIGIFEMGITFVFWLYALKFSQTTAKVGNLVYLSPFLSLFFIRIIVGEQILPATIVGLILIVVGIVVQQYKKN